MAHNMAVSAIAVSIFFLRISGPCGADWVIAWDYDEVVAYVTLVSAGRLFLFDCSKSGFVRGLRRLYRKTHFFLVFYLLLSEKLFVPVYEILGLQCKCASPVSYFCDIAGREGFC